ncbi:ABC transporter substrate-binding protein [Rhodocaloribacter litoris]|uniref:ABC transporter substrate-binding protein n=1 Tax=Rhodocaloribacter litoris TaxID=2558931 RepID=UPI00141E1989|nr:ABC transporter substrate-binding protein [Rhodocaloribacter litoris]QXD16457.1 ABC transporter substrate-binding protein [Rhodocaloribacter litoris]
MVTHPTAPHPILHRLLALLLIAGGLGGAHVQAQDLRAPVPRIEAAEEVFAEGLEAFEAGDYGLAFRRFQIVIDQYPLNRKTTAAWLMSGKALYRNGAHARAAALLETFIASYPSSRYVDEARRTRELALAAGTRRERPILNLGIALPMDGPDLARTQSMFNGIRMAVDEHNRTAGDQPLIRMIFRNTHNSRREAAAQVRALAEAGADVILGPLYSIEAEAAAEAAEQAGVVLVAPLATDESVSAGRRYVFQSNPTITMRGRLMARFAIRGLRLHRFGLIAELGDSVGERMAEGFQDEALHLGAEVPYFVLLEKTGDWYRLPETIGADSLKAVEALYLPIPDGGTALAEGVLGSLARSGTTARLLGGKTWHNLPIAARASPFQLTYTNDFFPDPANPEVQRFEERYRELTGTSPDRLAYTGYDVARYLIAHRTERPDRPFDEVLREAPAYEGLSIRIHFNGENVNQALFYHRYRDGRLQLLR